MIILGGIWPSQYFRITVRRPGRPEPVPMLRDGVMTRRMAVHSLLYIVLVPPGKAVRFWREAGIYRYFDMSMPGRYRVRFAVGQVKSNWLKLAIKPPLLQVPPRGILRPCPDFWNRQQKRGRGRLRVRLFETAHAGATAPEGVCVYLRKGGSKGDEIGLTGNRLLDMRAVEVDGSDGYNGDELVKKPKPHYIPIPNHQQVPLTAYGKWLLKHPPKKLPAKTYMLKPGVVYRYAVPINLICQYDMSLLGTYHVRVELAHPKIWSNWIKVKVPQ